MKVLITGSTGLVGTSLASALARDGHTVCRLIRPQSAVTGASPFAEIHGKTERFDVAWSIPQRRRRVPEIRSAFFASFDQFRRSEPRGNQNNRRRLIEGILLWTPGQFRTTDPG